MSRSTDGEFELVLGNKQLLSLFFLVVVLFAVFFSLGYMVGKSVGPAPTMAAAPATATRVSELAAAPSPNAEPPAVESSPPPPATVSETQPARGEAPAAAPAPPAKEEAPPAPTPPAVIARDLHLQLAAVRVREDAEALAESLRKKGYEVLLNSETGDGWFRVLIGPFPDERAARKMKAKLEKDGYKSILKKP